MAVVLCTGRVDLPATPRAPNCSCPYHWSIRLPQATETLRYAAKLVSRHVVFGRFGEVGGNRRGVTGQRSAS
jgi:hypothetical protein